MLAKLRSHLTYANVMVTMLAFVVLGGGSAVAIDATGSKARGKVIRGKVKTKNLANRAVTTAKLRNGAVATSKLANGAVTNSKLGDAAVNGAKVADGSIGESDLQSFSFTTATLVNGWATVGTSPSPSFGKDALGFVHLRGRLRAGGAATTAFTLPAGMRPGEAEVFSVANISGGNSTPCVLSINTTGDVIPGVTGADTGCNPAGTIGISGVTFKAGG